MGAYIVSTFELIIYWIGLLICKFAKLDKTYNIAICLILIAIATIFTNPICEIVLNAESEADSIYNIASAGLLIFIAIILSLKHRFKYND